MTATTRRPGRSSNRVAAVPSASKSHQSRCQRRCSARSLARFWPHPALSGSPDPLSARAASGEQPCLRWRISTRALPTARSVFEAVPRAGRPCRLPHRPFGKQAKGGAQRSRVDGSVAVQLGLHRARHRAGRRHRAWLARRVLGLPFVTPEPVMTGTTQTQTQPRHRSRRTVRGASLALARHLPALRPRRAFPSEARQRYHLLRGTTFTNTPVGRPMLIVNSVSPSRTGLNVMTAAVPSDRTPSKSRSRSRRALYAPRPSCK